jgi:hypothetical protein
MGCLKIAHNVTLPEFATLRSIFGERLLADLFYLVFDFCTKIQKVPKGLYVINFG